VLEVFLLMTREDLNNVTILERERGERDATVRSEDRIDPRADRPASRSAREQGDANGSERLRQPDPEPIERGWDGKQQADVLTNQLGGKL